MTPEFILFHYDEIGLKGGNRSYFENKLKQNIKAAIPKGSFTSLRTVQGRLVGKLSERGQKHISGILSNMENIFGLAYCAPASRCPQNTFAICDQAFALLKEEEFSTFRITARRSGSDIPFSTQKMNEDVGAFIVDKLKKKVKLKNPDLACFIDMFHKHAYLYTEKTSGPGGLPVGVSGKAMCMLSGGIDSPLAAFYAMKRGARISLVHFHSIPYTNSASVDKVREITEVLGKYQKGIQLYTVPLGPIQKRIRTETDEKFRVLLYRRFMIRIAEALAKKEKAKAVYTGEVLGQVASQTLENMAVVEAAASLPMLRPLIGLDKREIVDRTKRIGTFEISIQPDQDCCSLFVPKHPATKARLKDGEREEAVLDVDSLVQEAIEGADDEVFYG